MNRVKIILPTRPLAILNVPVRIGDINYGNHVGNDACVSILHEARVQWLRQLHYTEINVCGTGLIMSDLLVEFKNESFYGDNIQVALYVGEISRVGFELFYQLVVNKNDKEIIIANAKTTMICFDYITKKVAALPAELKIILTN
jgi:acyl-CoA thioester hydrolase